MRGKLWTLTALWALWGCGGPRDPVQELSRQLERYPEYMLVLDDLRVEEGFFPDYFLRFKIHTASGQRLAGRDTLVYEERPSPWYEVSEGVFARYEHYLGMVVASRTREGRRTGPQQAYPPGYQYVGNTHYGFWGAGGFWQFYGQYAFMRDMLGGWRVGRNDYGDYRRSYERGRSYYGPVRGGRPTFGTRGRVTQRARPEFYRRYQQRARSGRMLSRSSRSSWGRGYSRLGK